MGIGNFNPQEFSTLTYMLLNILPMNDFLAVKIRNCIYNLLHVFSCQCFWKMTLNIGTDSRLANKIHRYVKQKIEHNSVESNAKPYGILKTQFKKLINLSLICVLRHDPHKSKRLHSTFSLEFLATAT